MPLQKVRPARRRFNTKSDPQPLVHPPVNPGHHPGQIDPDTAIDRRRRFRQLPPCGCQPGAQPGDDHNHNVPSSAAPDPGVLNPVMTVQGSKG